MLPSRGLCHTVFLLNHTLHLRPRVNVDDWVTASRSKATFMAQSADLRRTAEALIGIGLVSVGPTLTPKKRLSALSERADRPTLVAIARLLLSHAPPAWLAIALDHAGVRREYIPSRDLEGLSWLGDELDRLLLDAYEFVTAEERVAFRKKFGNAAELLVLAAKTLQGAQPIHVAAFSDVYGYDIECRLPTTERIEVKAASENTRHRFHLSRNEYDKSRFFGAEWRLVQVVFSTRAFIAERITAYDIAEVLELDSAALSALVPPDTESFRWAESAEISAPIEAWRRADLVMDPDFTLDSFRRS
jgi:hypothetical protein